MLAGDPTVERPIPLESTVAEKIAILMPYAEAVGDSARRLAPRVERLRGASVGIVNNSWRCMNVVADEYRRILTEEYGVSDIVEKRISATQTLPPDMVDDLVERCDAVLVGIGN
jgi:hypothetical protein